eukprot:CAMPEP_0182864632 /NCGR_PEP_ID=MMETSP0034_2-20130328/7267_1 /TAXON_ID=156128 /ORGANISM="Nephroselmis pyriformis, Strain CCMP717" /LENGTH=90 /DNA_ID=CAMNT_0024996891 /DNA_START=6 /DNA_END=278 /DNA_ORIENTATION=+
MASHHQNHADEQGALDGVVGWMHDNKLKTVGTVWLTAVGTTFAYNMTRPLPTQLKIMHTRVYAQAITLAALGASAVVEGYYGSPTPKEEA